MNEFTEVTVCLSREFLSQLKINCQAKNLFPELKKRQTTAMECLGLMVMLVANNADEEQIEDLLPDEWYGHIGTPGENVLQENERLKNEIINLRAEAADYGIERNLND